MTVATCPAIQRKEFDLPSDRDASLALDVQFVRLARRDGEKHDHGDA